MKMLITAGATDVPIDQVRSITNIFKGRTGADIALEAVAQGHQVTLLTANPLLTLQAQTEGRLVVKPFKMFDQLAAMLEHEVRWGGYDAIFQSAAISDFEVDVVYGVLEDGTRRQIVGHEAATKIRSSYKRLIIECQQTIKLVDQIREPWGFKGTLVKFKLLVGVEDEELLEIACESRVTSQADLIIANTKERAREYAFIVSEQGTARVARPDLASELLRRVT
jgi:phosphopantothenate-cysteine ligase/phosphopantothenoylcysteine decarboxylase/phosphopantothenate--cysteine ligase